MIHEPTVSPARARLLAVANALCVAGVVAWNGWIGAVGLEGRTVASVSAQYETAFTPAGYAFSIWGLIFLGLCANAGYQLWLAFVGLRAEAAPPAAKARATFFGRLGPWLLLAHVANAVWLVLWLEDWIAWSLVCLTALLLFLVTAMWRLDMEVWDAPLEIIAWVWWPIVVYAGWVTVAVLANLSALVARHGLVSADSEVWALVMIGLATLYNLFLVVRRNLREHALVAVWALVAIAVARWDHAPVVKWTALAAALVLMLVAGAHAIRNRRTLPLVGRLF